MLWEVLKTTSKHVMSSSSAACLCLISFTSPAKSLSVGPPCSTWQNEEEERERENRMHHHFVWIPIAIQTKLAWVMRKIYKTVSSFCVLAFSVKKIDGFIMPLHCVHVWVCGTECQHSMVLFGEASPAIDGAL